MQMTQSRRLTLTILAGLCAIIWTVGTVLDVIGKTYIESKSDFIFQASLNLVWIVIFIGWLIKYLKARKEAQ